MPHTGWALMQGVGCVTPAVVLVVLQEAGEVAASLS